MGSQRLSHVLGRLQCSSCWFISTDLSLVNTTNPCPSCGMSGESRRGYPSLSALRLLDIIQHFYRIVSSGHQDNLSRLSQRISELLGCSLSSKAIYRGWLKINRVYRDSKDSRPAIEAIKRFFRCNEDHAMSVLQVYMTEPEDYPEEIAVSISAVTLVEILLNDLLKSLKIRRQRTSPADAQREVAKLRSFEERFVEFADITGTDLAQMIRTSSKSFWDKWVYVRRKRNYFIHGNAYAIGWETAKRAYELAVESVGVFAVLNNQFVIEKNRNSNIGNGSILLT